MIGEGAEGATLRELTSALGFADADKSAATALFRQLLSALPAADSQVSLAMANTAVFNSRLCTLQDTYRQVLEAGYDAPAWSLDLDRPDALQPVNAWVNEHTHGLIGSMIGESTPGVVLYLLNAIYFKAAWSEPFNPKASDGRAFFGESGERFIKMVYRRSEMTYAEHRDGARALRLPLAGGRYAMTLVLPPADKSLAACLKDIDALWLQSLEFGQYDVEARIPVFTTDADVDLKSLLPALGVSLVFNEKKAELPLMASQNDAAIGLYVSQMKQRTRLGVDEEGCEGAAATLAEMRVSVDGGNDNAKVFNATRPFFYYVSELSSGTILFTGQFCGD